MWEMWGPAQISQAVQGEAKRDWRTRQISRLGRAEIRAKQIARLLRAHRYGAWRSRAAGVEHQINGLRRGPSPLGPPQPQHRPLLEVERSAAGDDLPCLGKRLVQESPTRTQQRLGTAEIGAQHRLLIQRLAGASGRSPAGKLTQDVDRVSCDAE